MSKRIIFTEPTGIMFHHFSGNMHPKVQGSIDAKQLQMILYSVGVENVLSAEIWLQKALSGTLKSTETCITFDDALLCQYDIAKPILDEIGIKAFWFIYTSIFEGRIEKLELFRYFRSTAFQDVNDFYEVFFLKAESKLGHLYTDRFQEFNPDQYLPNSPFYTSSDRWFRYLRDNVLSEIDYISLVEEMMDEKGFNRDLAKDNLWLRAEHISELCEQGHIIGLHSHTHPTTMAKLSLSEQRNEYHKNAAYIKSLTGRLPIVASHPCNSYSYETLQLLSEMDVQLAFRADTAPIGKRSKLEYCREDHANLLLSITGN